jgi:hypothetical protein
MTSSRSGQYLTGMCIAGLGVCAGGWLMVTAFISARQVPESAGGKWDHAAVTILATGAGLVLVAVVTFACWAMAWRQVLRADGVLFGEARRRSRRDARRLARQAARKARLEAAAARREARQASREARTMGKRERAIQAEQARPVPVNVDLGTIRREDVPEAGFGSMEAEPEAVRPPNADRVLAQLRDLLGPLITALDAEPVPAQRDNDDLVAVCADGVISYDAEEAW